MTEWNAIGVMISLSDRQLNVVLGAAGAVPVEKRDLYLQRIAAMLTMRGRGHFGDDDVQEVAALALRGLSHRCGLARNPPLRVFP